MHASTQHTQHGFGLIESLVALVVVSVGMIGIAALYGQGLGASRTALLRTHAVNLASDMADRIRMNRRGGAGYNGAGADSNCDAGDNVDCTAAQMAAHDVWAWNQRIGQLLPGGAGVVQHTAAALPTYTITITWQDGAFGAMTHQSSIRVPDL